MMGAGSDTRSWEDPAWRDAVRSFGERLGLDDAGVALLRRALTHRSLAETAPEGDNERLEFLGDSILALLVNEHLYRSYPEHAEGQLTRLKQRYVSEPSLAQAAAALGFGTLLLMAPNDVAAGGRERPSVLSDAFEAVLAALYLSRGLEAARSFVREELIARVDPTVVWDYKSRLQELLQERRRVTPVYRTEAQSGPAHDRLFSSEVHAGEELLGRGTGKSKKLAEQASAQDALSRLEAKPARKQGKKAAAGETR